MIPLYPTFFGSPNVTAVTGNGPCYGYVNGTVTNGTITVVCPTCNRPMNGNECTYGSNSYNVVTVSVYEAPSPRVIHIYDFPELDRRQQSPLPAEIEKRLVGIVSPPYQARAPPAELSYTTV